MAGSGRLHRAVVRDLGFLPLVCLFIVGTARATRLEISPIRAESAILIEATTGQVLYAQDPDRPRAPASIVKLMLELVVLEKVEQGGLRLDEPVMISAWASKMGGSQVYLAHGELFPLDELFKAIAIASANDACVAVAERVAGSVEGFVDLMNVRARDLGLRNTRYVNVHGLDDMPGEGNLTTARDIATIAQRLVRMPHVLEWSSVQEAPFRQGEFILRNTNKLLGNFPGLDGLKTGFTARAGYCLCATAERGGMRLISVVLGAESNKMRFTETARLLGAAFSQLRISSIVEQGDAVSGEIPVLDGRKRSIAAVAGSTIAVVLPERAEVPRPVLIAQRSLRAPIARGDTIGTIEVTLQDGQIRHVPALAAADMKKATLFQRLGRFFGGNH